MAVAHGATGIVYFAHQFQPKFDAAALLHDPAMLAAVTSINHEIQDLSPTLLTPTLDRVVTVLSSNDTAPVDTLVKRHDARILLIAVGMRNLATKATFTIRGLKATAVADVVGEGRTIQVRNGRFSDDFAAYGAHIYWIR
jgi:ethanolamine utilization protein EutP (predicted NTPase)